MSVVQSEETDLLMSTVEHDVKRIKAFERFERIAYWVMLVSIMASILVIVLNNDINIRIGTICFMFLSLLFYVDTATYGFNLRLNFAHTRLEIVAHNEKNIAQAMQEFVNVALILEKKINEIAHGTTENK